jgi:UDP-galactopyranose mutase
MIEKMQEGVDVKLGVDFLKEKEKLEKIAETIVYTGPIDEFFGSSQGDLEYRSLKFETEVLDMEDFQGVSLVNYPEEEIPWTRICEHKHFDLKKEGKTVITREYPHPWSKGEEKFYPINDEKNNSRYLIYRKMAESLSPKYIFGGRLAEYKYYDMNQVIASSLTKFKRYLEGRDK